MDEDSVAKAFDDVDTDLDSQKIDEQQVTLSADQSDIGNKRSRKVTRPAHLMTSIGVRRWIGDMIRDVINAGLSASRTSWSSDRN